MITLNIVSRHAKLSDAVAAAGIDLSYNEPLARADLARDDRDARIREAFVVTNSRSGETEVWFRYACDLQLLNQYSPFHSCLHSSPFSHVIFSETEITISEPRYSRSARKTLATLPGWTFAAV
jgi:hypothetical protein